MSSFDIQRFFFKSFFLGSFIESESFSLKCFCKTKKYDTQIVPLIRRMSNLEELTLNIEMKYQTRFVDGVQMNNEILVHLPK